MARPFSSAAAMTSASRLDPPGWITAVAPASAAASSPSAKGKNASDATTQPSARERSSPAGGAGLGRLVRCDPGGIDAAHLARADTDRSTPLGVDDGVRLHMLGDGDGEEEVGALPLGRRAPSHRLERRRRDPRRVLRLHQEAVLQRAHHEPFTAVVRRPGTGQEEAQVALGGEDGTGVGISLGRDHDLGEEAGDGAGGGTVQRPVGRDHPAEGAHRVAGLRLLVGGHQRVAEGDAAGVAVLDDGDRRRAELAHQRVGRIGIGEVVVARLLALDQRGLGDAGGRRGVGIEGGGLMRVLAVAQQPAAGAAERHARGQEVFLALGREPAGDGGVVGGRARERRRCETPAERKAGGAAQRRHLRHHRLIVRGLHHHRHVVVVLGRGPNHGRSADIDGLDAGVERSTVPHRLLEGVEVDRDQVDAGDPVRLQRRAVAGVIPAGENPAVDRRVQGLDPAVHDLGKAGMVGDVGHSDTRVADCPRGAAGRQDGDAPRRERRREGFQAGLVRDRDQGAGDGPALRVGHRDAPCWGVAAG